MVIKNKNYVKRQNYKTEQKPQQSHWSISSNSLVDELGTSANWPLGLERQYRLFQIIKKIETIYSETKCCVSLQPYRNRDEFNFTQDEIDLINSNPDIFYKCTRKRVLLTIWIVDLIDQLFQDRLTDLLDIEIIYMRFQMNIPLTFDQNVVIAMVWSLSL